MKRNPILVDVAKRSLATIQRFLYMKHCFIERNNSSVQDSIVMFKGSILNMSPVIFIIYIFVTKARFLFVLVLWNNDIHGAKIDSTWDIQMNFSFGNQLRNKLYCKRDLQCYYWSSHYSFFFFVPESLIITLRPTFRARLHWQSLKVEKRWQMSYCYTLQLVNSMRSHKDGCKLLTVICTESFQRSGQKCNFIYCCFIYFSFWMP